MSAAAYTMFVPGAFPTEGRKEYTMTVLPAGVSMRVPIFTVVAWRVGLAEG